MLFTLHMVDLLGLPRCLSLLFDLMILQYSFERLEEELSVYAEEAFNGSDSVSDGLKSAAGDDDDSRILRLKKEYGVITISKSRRMG